MRVLGILYYEQVDAHLCSPSSASYSIYNIQRRKLQNDLINMYECYRADRSSLKIIRITFHLKLYHDSSPHKLYSGYPLKFITSQLSKKSLK